ncbi:MAG: hypothetical protein AABW81_00045 [Nanoarchaeota archaeon]
MTEEFKQKFDYIRNELSSKFEKEMNVIDKDFLINEKYERDKPGVKHFRNIEGDTLNEVYHKSIIEALKYGRINYIERGSCAGQHRIEFDEANIMIYHPTATKPIAPTSRPGITVSTNDENIEEYFQNYLIEGVLKDREHYTYGGWIVGIPKTANGPKGGKKILPLTHKSIPRGTRFNQLEWCLNYLSKSYDNNHAYITIGCAEGLQRYDWPYTEETKDTERGTTECLRQILFKVRDNRLNVKTVWRSWDLISGFPENLGGMIRLMEHSVEYINAVKKDHLPELKPGILKATSDGLHIYEEKLDIAKLWAGLSDSKKDKENSL